MSKTLKNRNNQLKISIIGLGYVGMALAIELNKKYLNVYGYDLPNVINEYERGICKVDTVSINDFNNCDINFTTDKNDLINSDVILITVPTDVDENKNPILAPLIFATLDVIDIINKSTNVPIICYESTVYPGATFELETNYFNTNNLMREIDYYIAYSPERINPGDKEHTINKTVKIIASPSTKAIDILYDMYLSIMDIDNGGDVVTSNDIIAAETTKMYENCQRDVLIALANEFMINSATIYGSNFNEVERLASTRWNSFDITPGLVGGHCIAVDPYYMINKAKKHNTEYKMLDSARYTNEYVIDWLANDISKKIHDIYGNNIIRIGILGVTYKPNVNDIRNSKAIELSNKIVSMLHKCGNKKFDIIYHDPNANSTELITKYNIELCSSTELKDFDVILILVKHTEYIKDIKKYSKMFGQNQVLFIDLSGACIDGKSSDKVQYVRYW